VSVPCACRCAPVIEGKRETGLSLTVGYVSVSHDMGVSGINLGRGKKNNSNLKVKRIREKYIRSGNHYGKDIA